jgi:diacylglycerol kinase family enzyme
MKWLAIVNPKSGRNRHRARRERLETELRDLGATCELTRYAGHARELARAAANFDGIAVAGGVGTLFEVLGGLDLSRQHLAIIPAGTGNSLARDLGLSNSAQGTTALRNRTSFRIDLIQVTFTTTDGTLHECYAATTIGLGYPAHVTQIGNQYLKRFKRWCYPFAATVATFSQLPFSVHIGYHGTYSTWKNLTGLLINNTQHSGNFKAFPQARLDDGAFDVMEMQAGCFRQNLHNLSVLSHIHLYTPANLTQTPLLHLALKHPQALMLDGEIIPHVTRLHLRIAPKILTCYHREQGAR